MMGKTKLLMKKVQYMAMPSTYNDISRS